MDIGFEKGGFETAYANDIEKFAYNTIKKNQKLKHMLLATTGFSKWARSSAWIERVASDHQAVGSNPSGPVFNAMPAREPGRVCQLAFKSLAFNTPLP